MLVRAGVAALAWALASCGGDTAPECGAAGHMIERCFGQVPADFAAACAGNPAIAEQLLVTDCAGAAGKSDLWGFFGFRQGRNQWCLANPQCTSAGLTCRPLPGDRTTTRCQDPALPGDTCDDRDDCAADPAGYQVSCSQFAGLCMREPLLYLSNNLEVAIGLWVWQLNQFAALENSDGSAYTIAPGATVGVRGLHYGDRLRTGTATTAWDHTFEGSYDPEYAGDTDSWEIAAQ
jgi:hypothetical protein